MGSRRTDPEAAVAAARAGYLAGLASTSNLEAGRRYGVPTAGTAAHAFVLLFPDEEGAFGAQVAAFGPDTTLLVDTYDIETAIRLAVEAAGPSLAAIRIDSGDLGREARRARATLDALGATGTRIIVTGDLDDTVRRRLGEQPGGRLRGWDQCGHGAGLPDRRVHLQAGFGGRPGGREALAGEGDNRGSEVGLAGGVSVRGGGVAVPGGGPIGRAGVADHRGRERSAVAGAFAKRGPRLSSAGAVRGAARAFTHPGSELAATRAGLVRMRHPGLALRSTRRRLTVRSLRSARP